MKILYAGIATAVALAATPALADAPAGPRAEVFGGFDMIRDNIPGIVSPDVRLENTGILYGVGAGWDFALGDSVSLGIDGEVSRSTAKLTKGFFGEFEYDAAGDTADIRYKLQPRWDWYVGPRVSFSISPNANVYVKGGYTHLDVRQSIDFNDTDTGAALTPSSFGTGIDDPFNHTSSLHGWRVGAGAQVGMGGGLYGGAEVRYSHYNMNVTRWQGALTLGYHFFHAAPPPPPPPPPAPEVAPPPPPPPPATQTCADGSVILATDVCPAPPPPPPPPAPAPERG